MAARRTLKLSIADLPRISDEFSDLKAAGGAKWQKLYSALRDEIVHRRWPEGTQLPSAADIAAHYCVNRHTVRRAFALLVQDGAISAARGRGTCVAGDEPPLLPLAAGSDYAGALKQTLQDAELRVLSRQVIDAGYSYAGSLALSPWDSVQRVQALTRSREAPVVLTEWIASLQPIRNLGDPLRRFGSIEVAYREHAEVLVRRTGVVLSAHDVDEQEAGYLKLGSDCSVVRLQAQFVDDDERIFALERSLINLRYAPLAVS